MHILEAGQHRFTTVLVLDEPGAGGAHHEYSHDQRWAAHTDTREEL